MSSRYILIAGTSFKWHSEFNFQVTGRRTEETTRQKFEKCKKFHFLFYPLSSMIIKEMEATRKLTATLVIYSFGRCNAGISPL